MIKEIILANMLKYNNNVLTNEAKIKLDSDIMNFLIYDKLYDKATVETLLDYCIGFDKEMNYCEIIGNNFITNLWLCGIFPKKPLVVNINKKYTHNQQHFSFDDNQFIIDKYE